MTYWKVDIFTIANCKILPFLQYCSYFCSSSLMVCMCIERFIALFFPLKANTLCTVKSAKRISLVIAVAWAAFNSQFFFTLNSEYIPDYDWHDCVNSSIKIYRRILYRYLVTLFYFYVPCAILIVLNSIILCKFLVSRIKQRFVGAESTDQALSKSSINGVVMMLVVSFTFLLLVSPVYIINFFFYHIQTSVMFNLLNLAQYLNHSINALLYCTVGSRFRQELKKTVCCRGAK